MIPVADQLRPTAPAAVARIRALALRAVLLTGDKGRAAVAVARQLGMPAADVFAGVRPAGKAEIIRRLQAQGQPVAFVGDCVNDAAALAQADLGLAVGTGTDAAIGAADLTLGSGDPAGMADAVALARAAMAVIRANLAWAAGYNVTVVGFTQPLPSREAQSGCRPAGRSGSRSGPAARRPAAAMSLRRAATWPRRGSPAARRPN